MDQIGASYERSVITLRPRICLFLGNDETVIDPLDAGRLTADLLRCIRLYQDDKRAGEPDVLSDVVDSVGVNRIDATALHPGDILFITHPNRLDDLAYHHLMMSLEHRFPDNRCLIIEEGMTVRVVRPEGVKIVWVGENVGGGETTQADGDERSSGESGEEAAE